MRCPHCPPRKVRRKLRPRTAEDILDAGRVELPNGGSVRVTVRKLSGPERLVLDCRYFTPTGARTHAGFIVTAADGGTLAQAVSTAAAWLVETPVPAGEGMEGEPRFPDGSGDAA